MNKGQFQIGIVSAIAGAISLITGATWALAGVKSDVAVHDTRITILERIASRQDEKLDLLITGMNEIRVDVAALAAKQGIQKVIATSTTFMTPRPVDN